MLVPTVDIEQAEVKLLHLVLWHVDELLDRLDVLVAVDLHYGLVKEALQIIVDDVGVHLVVASQQARFDSVLSGALIDFGLESLRKDLVDDIPLSIQ